MRAEHFYYNFAVPDSVRRVSRSAAVSYINSLKYLGSITVCTEVEVNCRRVSKCQHSNAAGGWIGFVCIHVQRIDY